MGPMRVTILPEREVKEVQAVTAGELLKALGLHRDAHLVVRGEDILTSDVRLSEADELEVWPVISGGGGPPPLRPTGGALPGRTPLGGGEPPRLRPTGGALPGRTPLGGGHP